LSRSEGTQDVIDGFLRLLRVIEKKERGG